MSLLLNQLQNLKFLGQRKLDSISLDFTTTLFSKTVAGLDRMVGTVPPKVRVDLIPIWNKALEKNLVGDLSYPDLKKMCWIPEIVNQPKFIDVLNDRKRKLGRGCVKGILFAIATSWNEFGKSTDKLEKYRRIVSQLNGSASLETCWPFIFSVDGPDKMSALLVKRKIKPSQLFMEVFGITLSGNEYLSEVLKRTAIRGSEIVIHGEQQEIDWYFDSVLNALPKDQLKIALEEVVRKVDENPNERAKERIIEFVVSHPNLGDPRLPGYESNWELTSKLAVTIMEWLSQGDIKFFFEMFFQNRDDSQGRKKFWMDYAYCVRGTRVIVSEADNKRYFSKLNEFKQKKESSRLIATLVGAGDLGTAFMMDFGKIKVVEFSQAGNACYFYTSESNFQFNNRNLFWNTKRFTVSELKNQEVCDERLSHTSNWEFKFSVFLAKKGVRAIRR